MLMSPSPRNLLKNALIRLGVVPTMSAGKATQSVPHSVTM